MAFFFGKKKSHVREGTPISNTSPSNTEKTLSSSLNNSLATLNSSEGSPDVKHSVLSQTPPTQHLQVLGDTFLSYTLLFNAGQPFPD